jgi:hypothetical protein
MHIVIDTCSWVNLILDDRFNPQILSLKALIDSGEVKLLTNDVLIKEWNKQKEIRKSSAHAGIATKNKHTIEVLKKSNLPLLVENIRLDDAHVKGQIEAIDDLLNKSASKYSESIEVKAKCSTKMELRLPPFHFKIDSMNDAYIIYGAIDYCEKNNIENLLFVSDNYTDFTDGASNCIHPEIAKDTSNVIIAYEREIGRYISNSTTLLDHVISESETTSSNKYLQNPEFYKLYKDESVLKQLSEFCRMYYGQIRFIPVRKLPGLFPFFNDIEGYSDFNYSTFTLSTNNKSLIDFFSNIKFNGDHTDFELKEGELKINDENDIRAILKHLTRNLIFRIKYKDDRESINIRFNFKEQCNCSHCEYEKFNFNTGLRNLNLNSSGSIRGLDVEEKNAFAFYQYGDYLSSFISYYHLSGKYLKNKNHIKYFICIYNLSKLKNLIRNIELDGLDKEYGEFKNNLDLRHTFLQLISGLTTDSFAREMIDFIYNLDFYSFSLKKIDQLSGQIEEYYDFIRNDGYGYNSYGWSIVGQYASYDCHLYTNKIIFDVFEEHQSIIDKFQFGLIGSLFTEDENRCSLSSFDKYYFDKFLLHGDPEKLVKAIKRFQKNDKNIPGSSVKLKLEILIKTIYEQLAFIQSEEYINIKQENTKHSLKRDLIRIINNTFILLSVIKLEDSFNITISTLTKSLLSEKNNSILNNNTEYIKRFIAKRGDCFTESDLTVLLKLGFTNQFLHRSSYISTINALRRQINIKFKFSDQCLIDLLNRTYDSTCEACKIEHELENIIELHCFSVQEIQKSIENLVIKSLKREFKPHVFQLAVLFDVIAYETFASKYEKSIVLEAKLYKKRKEEDPSYYHSDVWDQLTDFINVGYKTGINFKERKFKELWGISPYYDWLLNLEGFDYSLFDPRWVKRTPLLYFLREFKKHKKIRKKIIEFLKDNVDEYLQRILINSFIKI